MMGFEIKAVASVRRERKDESERLNYFVFFNKRIILGPEVE